jgi:hypothetical protein
MRATLSALIVMAITGAASVAAQAPTGGTITGIVLDASGQAIANADVFALPDKARGRTDSTGRFSISKLEAGFYHVRVRRLGYRPTEITTDLTSNGHVDLKFELAPRPVMLDSVVVQADGKCPAVSYVGFNCRKRVAKGKGVFLTDDDIADKGAVELGEVFTDVPGFLTELRPTAYGLKPIAFAQHGGCINALVNGRPIAVTNQLPRFATELIAVEIYATPRDVPVEYQRYIWAPGIRQSSPRVGRDHGDQACSLVVYWTSFS